MDRLLSQEGARFTPRFLNGQGTVAADHHPPVPAALATLSARSPPTTPLAATPLSFLNGIDELLGSNVRQVAAGGGEAGVTQLCLD